MSTDAPLLGQMMTESLLVSSLLRHAARHHGAQEIVSRLADGRIHRYTYRECEQRARRVARMLASLGVRTGDRVATLASNTYRHLELYYGISGGGAVCHTVNPRLFVEQIAYIINDAADTHVFFDAVLLSLVESIAPQCPGVRGWIALSDSAERPDAQLDFDDYESLLARADDDFVWPELDERLASSLCYTSGTTGHPKGVLYSHRSTVLHSFAACLPDTLGLDAQSVVLPIVPMFHANAWGLPYAAPMVGAKLVLPGPKLDSVSICDLLETERVSCAAAVPTVWVGLLDHVAAGQRSLPHLRRAVIGGAATPLSMIEALARLQVDVRQAWGMTETSPIATSNALLAKHTALSPEAQQLVMARQGRAVYGCDIKISDDEGQELPWDGIAMGQIMARGLWTASRYFNSGDPFKDGWLPTGDIATIDPDGYIEIKDRAKDLIKSGGEWISSIALENIAIAHPAVQQAACIALPHPKWGERPMIVAVLRKGSTLSCEELRRFFEGKVAKWEMPDSVVFVEALPLTATGKLNKLKLRTELTR